MSDTESVTRPHTHLVFRIAVGAAGLALLALVVMLGSVALKQSATTEALATGEALRDEARPAPARDALPDPGKP
jgi:hypothetical protein